MEKTELTAKLMEEMKKLHHRQELSGMVGPDYYEPGMMEYLDKSDGYFDAATGELTLRFEIKGTRYEGRTECIENVREGNVVKVIREKENTFNPNNFNVEDTHGNDLGNFPAELCNALAPLYDAGFLAIKSAKVSFVEPVSQRSRHAKQAVLFVELICVFA